MNKRVQIQELCEEIAEANDLQWSHFQGFYSKLEIFLKEGWKHETWDLSFVNSFVLSLQKMMQAVHPQLYGTKVPVLSRLLWFCDDFLRRHPGFTSQISSFHAWLIEFRREHISFFVQKRKNVFEEFESQAATALAQNYSARTFEIPEEEEWYQASLEELQKKVENRLSVAVEEKDFEKLGVLLWRTFQHWYFHRDGLSEVLDSFTSALRRVLFQIRDHSLFFHMLGFLPVILEQEYSAPFQRKRDGYKLLFLQMKGLTLQIHFDWDDCRKLSSLVEQYWKFFFHFLRTEKFRAFEIFCEIFVVILEKDFEFNQSTSHAAEISEVFWSLGSLFKKRYRNCILKNLKESVSRGSLCFLDLFGANQENAVQLTEKQLMNEVLLEVFRDGKVDEQEREILLKLFSFLKIEKEDAKKAMVEAQKLALETRDGKSLDSKGLMKKILSIATLDGKVDDKEKVMINALGAIMGLGKVEIRELWHQVQSGTCDKDEILHLSLFTFNREFELNWQNFREENFQTESLQRGLKSLLEAQTLTLEGDEVNFGTLPSVPVEVELSQLEESSQPVLFFFVDKRGVLVLREIVQSICMILVHPGQESSRLDLRLSGGEEICVQQKSGLHLSSSFYEGLAAHHGRILICIVDHQSREIISHFEQGCSICDISEYKEWEEALEEENILRIKLLYSRSQREKPWNRMARNFWIRALIRFSGAVDKLQEIETLAKSVMMEDPSDCEFFWLYGKVLLLAGRKKDAVLTFRKSLRAWPRYLPALSSLVQTLENDFSGDFYLYFKQFQVYYGDSREFSEFWERLPGDRKGTYWAALCETPFVLV